MSILPPWVRLVPWLAALLAVLALWAMFERAAKLDERAETAQAKATTLTREVEARDTRIEALRDDARKNDELLRQREIANRKLRETLAGTQRELDRLRNALAPSDCLRAPIGDDLHRVLAQPPDPGR